MSKLQGVRARLADFRKQKQLYGSLSVENVTPTKEEDECLPQPPVENVTETNEEQVKSPQHVENDNTNTKSSWLETGLKISLWLLLWGFFIEVGFGMVYFVCSCLVLMVLSLRGGKKRPAGVPSAYSVFNKNFETIDGTFTAEQFEQELRYGPNSVR